MPNKRKTPSIASDDGDDEYRSKRDRNNQVSLRGPLYQHQHLAYNITKVD